MQLKFPPYFKRFAAHTGIYPPTAAGTYEHP